MSYIVGFNLTLWFNQLSNIICIITVVYYISVLVIGNKYNLFLNCKHNSNIEEGYTHLFS